MKFFKKHFKKEIIESFRDPILIDNFLSKNDIAELKEIEKKEEFFTRITDRYEITPPRLLIEKGYEAINNICQHLDQYMEYDYEIQDCYLQKLKLPSHVHIDTNQDIYEKAYKRITCLYGLNPVDVKPPSMILFDQRYVGNSIGFMKGSLSDYDFASTDNIDEAGYNYQFNSYEHLINFNDDKPFEDIQFYEENLKHIRYSNLDGLTVDKMAQHDIGKMIMFDSCQLHSSNNWSNIIKHQLIFNIVLK